LGRVQSDASIHSEAIPSSIRAKLLSMTKDDQRVRETVQAELRRRRGALDRSEERAERPITTNGHNGHAVRSQAEERPEMPRRQWSLPSGTTRE